MFRISRNQLVQQRIKPWVANAGRGLRDAKQRDGPIDSPQGVQVDEAEAHASVDFIHLLFNIFIVVEE